MVGISKIHIMNLSTWLLSVLLTCVLSFPKTQRNGPLQNVIEGFFEDGEDNMQEERIDESKGKDVQWRPLLENQDIFLSRHMRSVGYLFQSMKRSLVQPKRTSPILATPNNDGQQPSSVPSSVDLLREEDLRNDTAYTTTQYENYPETSEVFGDGLEKPIGRRSPTNNLVADSTCHAIQLKICSKVFDDFGETFDFVNDDDAANVLPNKCTMREVFLDCMMAEREKGCTDEELMLSKDAKDINILRNKIYNFFSSGCLLVVPEM